MNEILHEFDANSQDYQAKLRLELGHLMHKNPLSNHAYSRDIGISPTTLKKFMAGGILMPYLIKKIERYLEGK